MKKRTNKLNFYWQIIESREPNTDGVVHVSQLNLVDLAGSERPKQTGATGDRFNEGKHINLSLSSLALVIMQLSEHQDNPQRFVNFRDSKLTRILRSSLGGNAMTTIICAVTPAAVEETQNTLAWVIRRANNKTFGINCSFSRSPAIKSWKKRKSYISKIFTVINLINKKKTKIFKFTNFKSFINTTIFFDDYDISVQFTNPKWVFNMMRT